MFKMRCFSKVAYKICILLSSCLLLSSCGNGIEDVDCNSVESMSVSEQMNENNLTYSEKRKLPMENELPMEQLNSYNSETDKNIISAEMKASIPDTVSNIYFYAKNDIDIIFYVENEVEGVGTVWIQGKPYPFSYGESYYPRGGENPEVCFYDINGDGVQDVLLRGEAYKTMLRQDVYLSDGNATYKELGDITWRESDLSHSFSFIASYVDNKQVQVTAPNYNIDKLLPIGTTFQTLTETLGIYDSNGKVTEYGRSQYRLTQLQGQAVRYMLQNNGTILLRYEAQIEAGYSEYCIGSCFVFIYEIAESGYQLKSVTLEEYYY